MDKNLKIFKKKSDTPPNHPKTVGRANGRGEKGPVLVALRCKEQSRFAFTAGGTQGLLLWTESRTPQSTAGCAGNQELDIWDGLGQSSDPTWSNPQLFWDGRQLWRPPAQLLTLSQHWGHTRRSGACPGHKPSRDRARPSPEPSHLPRECCQAGRVRSCQALCRRFGISRASRHRERRRGTARGDP